MCGIIGYIGSRNATQVLVDGLDRLSYRGYDSAGIAVMGAGGQITIRKTKGKLIRLKHLLNEKPVNGIGGIGHTRWATHGEPSDLNAHPHTSAHGGIAVVHNGIIENAHELRERLENEGVAFISQTDTEVIAHLLEQMDDGDMVRTLLKIQTMLKGSYAIGVMCSDQPGKIFCTRRHSSLAVAYENGEGWIASDIPALLPYTRNVLWLQDGWVGALSTEGLELYNALGEQAEGNWTRVPWNQASAEKNGFPHFMLKEIYEQPSAIRNMLAHMPNWKNAERFPLSNEIIKNLSRVIVLACGTAYHAGLLGAKAFEELAGIPAQTQIASEYHPSQTMDGKNELVIAVSQSGETADTLSALRKARMHGAYAMAICNVEGSAIEREAGEGRTLYTSAGPEIAVASTKAYLTQSAQLIWLASVMGMMRGTLMKQEAQELYQALQTLPEQIEAALQLDQQMRKLAKRLHTRAYLLLIGRGADAALVSEAALKIKEVSYMVCEAYAAGELKHGPIAMLERDQTVIACITQNSLLDKMIANLQEVRSRGAEMVVVCSQCLENQLSPYADEIISVPDSCERLAPLLAAVPLQLLAYHIAIQRQLDPDQPRNLAKSVTVE